MAVQFECAREWAEVVDEALLVEVHVPRSVLDQVLLVNRVALGPYAPVWCCHSEGVRKVHREVDVSSRRSDPVERPFGRSADFEAVVRITRAVVELDG